MSTPRQARRPRHRPSLLGDEGGSFVVLEAVLVAMLVLTAILFFTTVQRPSSGQDQGGLDLAQVSADTLRALQVRTFVIGNGPGGTPCTGITGESMTLEALLTNVSRGEPCTRLTLSTFMTQVLPVGARYSLRLNNGVQPLEVLATTSGATVHGGRVTEVPLLPSWTTYRNSTTGLLANRVYPGQILDATSASYFPLVNPSSVYLCFASPSGATTTPTGATWASHWKTTPTATTDHKTQTSQVPLDLPLGRWRVSNVAAVNDASGVPRCATTVPACLPTPTATPACVTYVEVVRPECVIAPSSSADCGAATLPFNGINPFHAYGLQLAVWFGA